MQKWSRRSVLRLQGPGGRTHLFTHAPRYVADDLLTLKLSFNEVNAVALGLMSLVRGEAMYLTDLDDDEYADEIEEHVILTASVLMRVLADEIRQQKM